MKRHLVVAVAVVGIALTAGCTGLVVGDGAEFEASPAAVDEDVAAESGYEHVGTEPVEINETVAALGQERRIAVTNWVATYERSVEVAGERRAGSVFAVASTPDVTVAGQRLNPIAGMDNAELVEEFAGQLGSEVGEFRDIRAVDQRTEPVLGRTANVTTFAAETTVEGQEVTVRIHLTTAPHEDDLLVAVGVHPEAFEQEASETFRMMRGIDHPVSEPAAN